MRLKVLHISCEGKSESFYRKSSPRLRLQANLSAQRRSLWNVLQPDKYKVQWQRCRGGQDKSFFQVLSFFFLRQRFTCWQDFCMHDSNWQHPTPTTLPCPPTPCATPLHASACLSFVQPFYLFSSHFVWPSLFCNFSAQLRTERALMRKRKRNMPLHWA